MKKIENRRDDIDAEGPLDTGKDMSSRQRGDAGSLLSVYCDFEIDRGRGSRGWALLALNV
eukprot:1161098-Pelagomonas_calceolata.AAC.2